MIWYPFNMFYLGFITTESLTVTFTVSGRGGPNRKGGPFWHRGKKNKPCSTQQTSMSCCNAKRDTSLVATIRWKQGNSKLSRYHRSQRKTRSLAVSVPRVGDHSHLKGSRYDVACLFGLWEVYQQMVQEARACPGTDGGWTDLPGDWRRAFVDVSLSRFFFFV